MFKDCSLFLKTHFYPKFKSFCLFCVMQLSFKITKIKMVPLSCLFQSLLNNLMGSSSMNIAFTCDGVPVQT